MDIKEKTLSMALSETRCRDLPKLYRDGDKGFWMKAIVLVKKRNLVNTYMLAEHKADGLITYTKDFAATIGHMSPMAGLIGIYPYIYLDEERYMPYKSMEQIRGFVAVNNKKHTSDYDNVSDEDMMVLCRECAIKKQLEDEETENFDNKSDGIEDDKPAIVESEQVIPDEDKVKKEEDGEVIRGDGDEFDEMKTLLTPSTSKPVQHFKEKPRRKYTKHK